MPDYLTGRQQQIFAYIVRCCDTGVPPTIRQIGAQFGINSPNGVMCHLVALRSKRYIDWTPNMSRTIRVVRNKRGIPLLSLEDLTR